MICVNPLRRIIYCSRAVAGTGRDDHQAILNVSRRNNGMDGISGILWIEQGRYLQLIEGPVDSVGDAFERIKRDTRHTDIHILDDRMTDSPEFGDWAMAGLPGDHPKDAAERLRFLLRNTGPDIRHFFPVD
ncbi:BLUF domain-containing protein [Sphingomonas sp.]|uniref:BLUF domain-containing protein n=1 Tax=Sphingomonas sp. TaxID=28214 RepID=UPI0031D7D596